MTKTKVKVRVWRVPSRRRPCHKYRVTLKRGKFGCNCLGFIYSDHKKPCFHIREVKSGGVK